MVSKQDIRELRITMREGTDEHDGLERSFERLEELIELREDPDITVGDAKISEAQESLKTALYHLIHVADDLVDRTDTMETSGGEVVDLPNAALSRDGGDVKLPSQLGDSS